MYSRYSDSASTNARPPAVSTEHQLITSWIRPTELNITHGVGQSTRYPNDRDIAAVSVLQVSGTTSKAVLSSFCGTYRSDTAINQRQVLKEEKPRL